MELKKVKVTLESLTARLENIESSQMEVKNKQKEQEKEIKSLRDSLNRLIPQSLTSSNDLCEEMELPMA